MKLPGRAAAAMDILESILAQRLPAALALREWGRAHRFAGSGDRAAIGTIVYDVLRRRASLGWRMEDDAPRALVLAHLAQAQGLSPAEIAALAQAPHGFGPLSPAERRALERPRPLREAPLWVRADIPRWLEEDFRAAFGERTEKEGAALARRAPLDIRVNTLKAAPEKVAKALARFHPRATSFSPHALRFRPDAAGRLPNVEADAAHARGLFEVQDEGSQIAALLTGAQAGMQALDLCAGAGGKTLALAAQMGNRGQIHVHDAAPDRLRPVFGRLRRAGVRNAQVIGAHARGKLEALAERMDIVLLDAPCSGSGTWRRRPDAKWRLGENALKERIRAQAALLRQAAGYVRPGGRLVYVTCSLLPRENAEQVAAFLRGDPRFALADWRATAQALPRLPDAPETEETLQLSPAAHGTDGFFIAVMRRKAG